MDKVGSSSQAEGKKTPYDNTVFDKNLHAIHAELASELQFKARKA